MKPFLRRRVARLESAALRRPPLRHGPATARSFQKQVETRMRLKGETLETAFLALVVHLEDHEFDALLAESGESFLENEPE